MIDNAITILHGVYVPGQLIYNLGFLKFDDYIMNKYEKFHDKYGLNALLYTIGFHISGVNAIAIAHPWDTFDPKIGEAIVRGRINRMRGLLKCYGNDGVERRLPYDPIPEYIMEVSS